MQRKHLRSAVVGVTLITGVATTLAVRAAFDRPGESALPLLPADAQAIITVDLIPAPSQMVAFSHAGQALEKAGGKGAVVAMIAKALKQPELGAAIAPYLGFSMAVATYELKADVKQLPQGIVLFSLTDSAATDAALGKIYKPVASKTGSYYPLNGGQAARVSDGYLELATSPTYFDKLDEIKAGSLPSVASVPTFKTAKSLSDPDANITLYIRNSGAWSTISGSLEDSGLRFVFRGAKGTVSNVPALTKAKPLDRSTLRKVPSGAYMLVGLAQPSVLFGSMSQKGQPASDPFEGALSGDMVISLYPSTRSPFAGLDLLIMLDASNGAKPATALKKLVGSVGKQFTGGEALFDKPRHEGDALYYHLAPSVGAGIKMASKATPASSMLGDMTIAYATEGETVYIGTSDRILKRAIAARNGKVASLVSDSIYKPAEEAVLSGSHFILDASLARAVEGIKHTPNSGQQGKKAYEALSALMHGDDIVSVNAGLRPDGSLHGRIFVPIDYNKLADLVAKHKQ
jgi:hypothetical protein